ncbi:A-kinase-interacting protein 1-like [Haliotis cracherodii]|uniref:A-kinase-interacting protein 1-like n=1 Tax=Haliotis cracherodii TaxID=6455 RepID=UPI0039EC5514
MSLKPCLGDMWAESTLERASRVGQEVLERTRARKVEWPSHKQYGHNPVQDPHVYTSLDDALASMLHYMSVTTKDCKRYYNSAGGSQLSASDTLHCSRFHTPTYTAIHKTNPLQRTEDVHILVEPGTYAVSAGAWGTQYQQKHVVHVREGNTVNMDFVL